MDWNWREGTLKVRFIHPGMEYHDGNGSPEHGMCTDDMGRIRRMIEQLLAE